MVSPVNQASRRTRDRRWVLRPAALSAGIRLLVTALVVGAAAGGFPVTAVAAAGASGGAGPVPRGPTRTRAWVAEMVGPSIAYTRPGGGRPIMHVPTLTSWDDAPVVALVLASRLDRHGQRWVKIRLDRRPDGSSGWIEADNALLYTTPWRIVVSLHARTVSVYRNGRRRFSAPAVVGAPRTPTPTGLFAIAERIRQTDPNAFDGAWVLQLTAFSDALRRFGGGPGTIGLHGRGGASLETPLGVAGSHGCIRVDNSVIARIAADVRPGTPVYIER